MYEFLQRHPRLARIAEVIGGAMLVNVLSVVASVTIVGMAPAIGATFSYQLRLARGEHPDLVDHYFKPLRALFWKSWGVLLMLVSVMGFAFFSVRIATAGVIPFGGVAATLSVVLAVLATVTSLYVWPILALTDLVFGEAIVRAARVGLGHLPWSLMILMMVGSIIALSVSAPIFGGIMGFGLAILVASFGAWRVLRRYVAGAIV
jgi:uncharacterized membrane protein YesL